MKGRMKNWFLGSTMAVCFIAALLMGGSVSAQEGKFPPLGPLPPVPVPADNPMSPAKVELGKLLFFDARLSGDASTSAHLVTARRAAGETGGSEPGLSGHAALEELPDNPEFSLLRKIVLGRRGSESGSPGQERRYRQRGRKRRHHDDGGAPAPGSGVRQTLS